MIASGTGKARKNFVGGGKGLKVALWVEQRPTHDLDR
jgi:hypothetical protein